MEDLYVIVLSAGVGLVAAWVRGYVDYTQTAIRELRVSALACLDCLEKLADRPVLIQHQFQPIEGLTRKLREETRLAH
jgi:hypothetical protein